ncbi:MAG: hypothetical protein JRN37_07160 [Nitrososphaerota archaeon]|jgi:hypothetical protein|nr:hypothetical protein [Nitrososphaerota archaeon]MDG7038911.1 hypothetical protein [Nitrososphaerota archaeon]
MIRRRRPKGITPCMGYGTICLTFTDGHPGMVSTGGLVEALMLAKGMSLTYSHS